jgi:HK97 family phage portal protein
MRNPFRRQKAVEFSPEVIETIRSGVWPWGTYAAMYARQPAVRTVVDFLASNIGQLNPKVYQRVSNQDRLEVDSHALAELLRQPNPRITRFGFWRDTVSDRAIYGRAYWEKLRSGGRVRGLRRIPPMNIIREDVQGVTQWRDETNGRTYSWDSLVIFRSFSPAGNTDGVAPMETLRRVLAADWESLVNREWFWKNAGRQSGWIKRPLEAPEWSDPARERFREGLRGVTIGEENAGKWPVLEDGMTPDTTGAFSPKDSEYVDGRKLTREEVALTFSPALAALLSPDLTKASAESFHRQLYQDAFAPWLKDFELELELQLLPDLEPNPRTMARTYVEFNLAEKLKGSFEEQAKVLTTAVGVPHMTINEGRARLNMDRIEEEWADIPVRPLNVMYGGQPAVTVPTEVPGERLEASYEDRLRKVFADQEQWLLSQHGRNVPLELLDWRLEDAKLAAATEDESFAREVNAATRDAILAAEPAGAEGIRAIFTDAQNGRAAHLAAELVRRKV